MENSKITFLTISCIMLLFFTLYLLNQNKKIAQVQSVLSDFITNLQTKEDFYQTNFEMGTVMNGLYAPDISCLENHHAKKLGKLVQDKPILIFVYKIECSACKKNELNELQDIFKENLESAYILCSHLIKRQIYIYAKEQQIKVPILGISENSFEWKAENYNKPYFFVLHPDMKISHVYFPSKEYSHLNKLYLEGVKRFLLEQI